MTVVFDHDTDTIASEVDEEFTDVPVAHSDVGASVPSPEEVRTTVNVHRGSSGRFLKVVMALVVIACVVIGVIIGVNIGGGGDSKSKSSSTVSLERQSTAEEIIAYMANSGVSDLNALTTEGSPQNRAAIWMSEEDKVNLPVPTDDGVEAYKYTTRYVMVVLYYSTGGDTTWVNQLGFMISDDVCDWFGIFAQGLIPYRKGIVCDSDTKLIVGLGISK
jgi:hypothetical protein